MTEVFQERQCKIRREKYGRLNTLGTIPSEEWAERKETKRDEERIACHTVSQKAEGNREKYYPKKKYDIGSLEKQTLGLSY